MGIDDGSNSMRSSMLKFIVNISDQLNKLNDGDICHDRGYSAEEGGLEQSKPSEFGEASDDKIPQSGASSTGFSLKNVFSGQKKKKDEDKKNDKDKGKNGSS